MPLSITRDQWTRETSSFGHRRSRELAGLDDAIGTGNPFLAKKALDEWIAAQTAKNQDWRTSVRNRGGAVQRLYAELGLANDHRSFADRLVNVTVNCRAGSRVLQAVSPGLRNESADLWRQYGYGGIVEEDTHNVAAFYETLGSLRRQVETGAALKVWLASAPGGICLGGGTFPGWVQNAIGSCAEMGSGDAALWAQAFCTRAYLEWSPYRVRIEAAKARGQAEQQAFERTKEERQRQTGEFRKPPGEMAARDGVAKYLKEFVRLNSSKPFGPLRQAFEAERSEMQTTFMLDADDPDLIPWEVARRGR